MKINFKYCISIVNFILATLSLFLVVPIALIGHDPASFDFIDTRYLFQVGVSSSIASWLCLIPLYALSGCFKKNKYLLFASIFIAVWISIAGYISPVIESAAMKSVFDTTVDYSSLLIVATVSFLAACLYRTRLYLVPTVFAVVIAVSSLMSSLPDVVEMNNAKKLNRSGWEAVSTLSKSNTVIVLSFDGVPGNIASEVLKNHPHLTNEFKDFIYYEKVVSAAPATQASLRGELFGVRNFRELGNTDAKVEKNLAFESLLINKHNDVFTYGFYNHYNLEENKKQKRGKTIHSQVYDHRNFRDLMITRVATSYGLRVLLKLKIFDLANKIGASFFADTSGQDEVDEFNSWSLNYAGPYWKLKHLIDAKDYDMFLSKLNSDAHGAVVRMLHFTHTHFPVDFDEECNFRSIDKAWFTSNQNQDGLYNEVVCDLSEFARFIRKLREIDVYRNALIVLKSDHGKPVEYFSNPPQSLRINMNPRWGYNRYQPLLMIKPSGRVADAMTRIQGDFLVSLADLAKTLCRNCGLLGMDCRSFPGIDLLGDIEFQAAENDHLFLDVVSDSHSSYRYEDHQTIAVQRRADSLLDALSAAGGVTLTGR